MADENEPAELRSRTIGIIAADEVTDLVIQHVYHPDGAVACECCGSTHDPGLAGLIVRTRAGDLARVLLTAEEAAAVANRLGRVVDLIYQSQEAPPDVEREMARLTAARTQAGEGEGSS